MRLIAVSCVLSLFTVVARAEDKPAPVTPPAREIDNGVHLIAGAIVPRRGPDGNTIVFDTPKGLVVVDTGRHDWHADAIIAYAREHHRDIVAIINTHWHLDHASGNARIKAAFPKARVFTTAAINRALAAGGFLARELESAKTAAADDKLDAIGREELEHAIATLEHADALRPDITFTKSGERQIGGRNFDVRVTDGAVTDADVWLYDASTRVAVLGDLVTFPAPFFETACPAQWRTALDEVWATPFEIAIPGHGEPMTRERFDRYRAAFGSFIDCVGTDAPGETCAAGWASGIEEFLSDAKSRDIARAYAGYYVEFLRKNGGRSPDCLHAPAS